MARGKRERGIIIGSYFNLDIYIYIYIYMLRIQLRIRSAELGIIKDEQENEHPNFPSFIPFLPPLVSFLSIE
ncbi:hypothetical protein FCV25MIE_14993 [Fagus crenata]